MKRVIVETAYQDLLLRGLLEMGVAAHADAGGLWVDLAAYRKKYRVHMAPYIVHMYHAKIMALD